MVRNRVVLSTLTLAVIPTVGLAQSLQPMSMQATGAYLFPASGDIAKENDSRSGWEAQIRYTWSRLSVGVGYQRSAAFLTVQQVSGQPESMATLNTNAVSVFFVEPRFVVAAEQSVASYLTGRLGLWAAPCVEPLCSQSTALGFGGGLGILVRLSSRVLADIGGQYFSASLSRDPSVPNVVVGYFVARAGLSFGL